MFEWKPQKHGINQERPQQVDILLLLLLLLLLKKGCLHFLPTTPHPPQSSPCPTLDPTPFGFVYVSFLHVPLQPCPLFPPTYHLITVSLFLISTSLVIFCLLVCFVDYVPVKGEIIWCLSFTTWLISLSILLSRSIQAVKKGRGSFFLSVAGRNKLIFLN